MILAGGKVNCTPEALGVKRLWYQRVDNEIVTDT